MHHLIHVHRKSTAFVLFVFWTSLIFQVTALKFIWGIELLSRITNTLLLIMVMIYVFHNIMKTKIKINHFSLYFLPGLFVFTGMSINLILSIFANINVYNQVGLLLPWVVYLSVPWFVKFNKIKILQLWNFYFLFMFYIVCLGLAEYFLVFIGYLNVKSIQTSGGLFMATYFSILYSLESGELYYRFYAAFMEPGTLAMFLIPAMVYALFWRKYIAFVVFLSAVFMSDSLGGYISATMLVMLFIFSHASGKWTYLKIFYLFMSLIFCLILVIFVIDYFKDRYEQKNLSATVREDNVIKGVQNIPSLLINHPFGIMRTESTEELAMNSLYPGNNFAPVKALIAGGFLSFVGYVMILLTSLVFALKSFFRKNAPVEEMICSISIICLFPFIVQRQTIWDCSLFALLFGPYILNRIPHGRKCNDGEIFFKKE